jgi:hypothetical protein
MEPEYSTNLPRFLPVMRNNEPAPTLYTLRLFWREAASSMSVTHPLSSSSGAGSLIPGGHRALAELADLMISQARSY